MTEATFELIPKVISRLQRDNPDIADDTISELVWESSLAATKKAPDVNFSYLLRGAKWALGKWRQGEIPLSLNTVFGSPKALWDQSSALSSHDAEEALAKIAPAERAVIHAHLWEERPMAWIAGKMNRSLGATQRLYQRGLASLRPLLVEALGK